MMGVRTKTEVGRECLRHQGELSLSLRAHFRDLNRVEFLNISFDFCISCGADVVLKGETRQIFWHHFTFHNAPLRTSVLTTPSPPLAQTHTHTPSLHCIISWEEVENFDSDDLWPEKAFVLINSSGKASVWVGSEFDEAGDDVEAYAKKAAEECSKVSGVVYKEVEAVADGDESDEFWDMFQLG